LRSIQQATECLHRPSGFQPGEVVAERFDQLAILHPGRTGRLACPAVQAQVEVLLDGVVQFELPVDDAAHEVDAAARAVAFEPVLDIRRACGGAEPAVDTVED
jgi:hypothetical protein